MSTEQARSRLKSDMQLKEYRAGLVEELIKTGLPIQIRSLREAQGMTQAELGEKAKMAQERVCRLEDPEYGRFTIATLLRLASAFDVGLVVRFAPFSEIMDWQLELSPAALAPAKFSEEFAFQARQEPLAQPKAMAESSREFGARQAPIIDLEEKRRQRLQSALGQFSAGIERRPLIQPGYALKPVVSL